MKLTDRGKLTVRDITLIGMMVAVIEVCKAALGFLPNIELTTFWIIKEYCLKIVITISIVNDDVYKLKSFFNMIFTNNINVQIYFFEIKHW